MFIKQYVSIIDLVIKLSTNSIHRNETVKIIFLIAILCGLTFPSVRITLAALLEGTSNYLYDSAKKEKTFIPYWLKKVRDD